MPSHRNPRLDPARPGTRHWEDCTGRLPPLGSARRRRRESGLRCVLRGRRALPEQALASFRSEASSESIRAMRARPCRPGGLDPDSRDTLRLPGTGSPWKEAPARPLPFRGDAHVPFSPRRTLDACTPLRLRRWQWLHFSRGVCTCATLVAFNCNVCACWVRCACRVSTNPANRLALRRAKHQHDNTMLPTLGKNLDISEIIDGE